MPRKLLLMVNPAAGYGKGAKIVGEVEKFLRTNDLVYESFFTKKGQNAKAIVKRRLDESFTDLLVIGGDGTLNDAINGIGDNTQVVVNVISTGTGNDFIKSVDVGSNLLQQLDTLLHGVEKTIDLGVCNERLFHNGVGIGFDGQIVADMKQKKKPLLLWGYGAYLYRVLRILSSYQEKQLSFSIDGKKYTKKVLLLTVANGTTFGGGFVLTPDAKVDDGLLDVCLIERILPWNRFLSLSKLGAGRHGKLEEVSFFKASHVSIEADKKQWMHIDGELLGHPPFEININKKALKVRVRASV
ncbi:diacylglycerol kinase family lipid kinase [Imperialibacter roseus]|uniref:Diacylglycerol kinase family lipid kinase n=1 Tax=Imperialibacter roseus TaxID=1324217 RepID=A0ABZ0IPP2_9BACT|nr:diacylglycerol kinase family lipid kinase [Imperialibacter roseus]WOK06429.1 diacylglycerol kinase family lipid kinase [Imperialibacter roseus]|tara:strand:- start:29504 stop:30400 length:897 start_codon:yes stop_codon:yes gene_type:complete